jgi:hypothetical protein
MWSWASPRFPLGHTSSSSSACPVGCRPMVACRLVGPRLGAPDWPRRPSGYSGVSGAFCEPVSHRLGPMRFHCPERSGYSDWSGAVSSGRSRIVLGPSLRPVRRGQMGRAFFLAMFAASRCAHTDQFGLRSLGRGRLFSRSASCSNLSQASAISRNTARCSSDIVIAKR